MWLEYVLVGVVMNYKLGILCINVLPLIGDLELVILVDEGHIWRH